MPRILFRLPLGGDGLPVYTFGVVLFVAVWVVFWLGWCLARRAGKDWDTYMRWATSVFLGVLVLYGAARLMK